MPNMTGVELAAGILAARADLPIILATGFGGSMTPAKAQALGIAQLLMKPVSTRSLGESVRRALDGEHET
jgi:FixJ family two-component response regulator